MQHRTPTTFFFAGTDTDAGKTHVACLVARWLVQQGQQVGVYKPVASGCVDTEDGRIADDAVRLWEAADRPRTLDEACPQRFLAPLAPPAAAQAEGTSVDIELLRTGAECWESDHDVLIVEGAGGLMSPLADGMLNSDLAKQFDCQLILVAPNRLGVIHQVLATCAAARDQGIEVAGIFLSRTQPDLDQSVDRNAEQIRLYTGHSDSGRRAVRWVV